MTGTLPTRPARLHRHQIARLSDAGWRKLQAHRVDGPAQECLAHWAQHRLPLVVTRQPDDASRQALALGLAAPGRWGRLRLHLSVAPGDVLSFDEFPCIEQALELMPASARSAWHSLCARLKSSDVGARVYGSYGWQLLSGLDHVRASSDADLWLSVSCADQADIAAACLQSFSSDAVRLDGELVFRDGAAVAWQEWLDWRAGRVKALLVKTLHGASLVDSPRWQADSEALAVR